MSIFIQKQTIFVTVQWVKLNILSVWQFFCILCNYVIMLKLCHCISKVLLDDLPKDFEKAIDKYNENIDEVFDLYTRQVAHHVHNKLGSENKLPLSLLGECFGCFSTYSYIHEYGELSFAYCIGMTYW